jgi:hypothetical protein
MADETVRVKLEAAVGQYQASMAAATDRTGGVPISGSGSRLSSAD